MDELFDEEMNYKQSAQDFNCFNLGSRNTSIQTGKQNDLSGIKNIKPLNATGL